MLNARSDIERYLVTKNIIAGSCQFVRTSLGSHDRICAGALALVETIDGCAYSIIAPSKICGLHIGPTQVFIAILVVTLALLLAVTESLATDTPAIGRIVTQPFETPDIPGLQPNSHT